MTLPRLSALLFVVLVPSAARAQVASHPLSSAEWKSAQAKLDPKTIPGYVFGFAPEPKQSFSFKSVGGQSLWIVPATFAATDPGAGSGAGPSQECGLFTLREDGGAAFSEIYGKHEPSMSGESAQTDCVAVKGVSFVAGSSGQPPLLLLAVASNTTFRPGVNDSNTRVFVCSWDQGTKGYQRDRGLEAKLTQGKGAEELPKTFGEAKQRLRALGM